MHRSTNDAKYLNWPGDTYIRALNIDLLICPLPEPFYEYVCAFRDYFSSKEFNLFKVLTQSIPSAALNWIVSGQLLMYVCPHDIFCLSPVVLHAVVSLVRPT